MAKKKPKVGRICLVSTFASVDTHVKLVKKNVIKKSEFTEGFVCWDAIPMYDISDDEVYKVEKNKLRKMCVPVDYKSEDSYCIVYEWQIKKVK